MYLGGFSRRGLRVRRSKVTDDDLGSVCRSAHENILRLEVAMDDSARVDVIECLEELPHD